MSNLPPTVRQPMLSRDATTQSLPRSSSNDPRPPREIAHSIEQLGIRKSETDTLTLVLLAVLAGAYISLGGLLYAVIVTDAGFGFGPTRLLGGIGFSLGLILIVVGGAELFTGNNLMAIAWASRKVSGWALCRHWAIVYCGNIIGCLATVTLVWLAGISGLGNDRVAASLLAIATAKVELNWIEAFTRGIMCNALVCLAVWLTWGARSVTDKILVIVFPIAAFVTMGFEHCIANWFFLPLAWTLDDASAITLAGTTRNLVATTLGNIFGGTVLVAAVYWFAYLRQQNE